MKLCAPKNKYLHMREREKTISVLSESIWSHIWAWRSVWVVHVQSATILLTCCLLFIVTRWVNIIIAVLSTRVWWIGRINSWYDASRSWTSRHWLNYSRLMMIRAAIATSIASIIRTSVHQESLAAVDATIRRGRRVEAVRRGRGRCVEIDACVFLDPKVIGHSL